MLQSNQLIGTVPTTFYQHARLIQSIHMYFNQFSDVNLDSWPTDIKQVLFEGSNYSRSLIDTQVERLPSLSMIDLSNTNLTGNLPLALWKLPLINVIEFTQNFLTGRIPELSPPAKLQRLHLETNQLSGHIPEALVGSKEILIDTLLFSENKLVGTIPDNITNLFYLDELKLDMNEGIFGTIPPGLGKLKVLREVSFVGTSLNGSIPEALCNQRTKALKVMRADCLPHTMSGMPQISCALGCCTTCCNSDGTNCVDE
jgi:hypothetical protein